MSVCNKKVIPYPLRAFGGSRPGVVKKNLVMKNTGKLFIWPFVQLVIILFLHLDRLNRSIGLRAILPRPVDFHPRPALHINDS